MSIMACNSLPSVAGLAAGTGGVAQGFTDSVGFRIVTGPNCLTLRFIFFFEQKPIRKY